MERLKKKQKKNYEIRWFLHLASFPAELDSSWPHVQLLALGFKFFGELTLQLRRVEDFRPLDVAAGVRFGGKQRGHS